MKRLKPLNLSKLNDLRRVSPSIKRKIQKEDFLILQKLAGGMSVVSLAGKYSRSESSIYRLYHRAEQILDETGTDNRLCYELLSRAVINIPTPLTSLHIWGHYRTVTYKIHCITLSLFRAGFDPYIPRWYLVRLVPGLCNRKRCLEIVAELSAFRSYYFPSNPFPVYDRVYYDSGIWVKFSETAEGLIFSVPPPVIPGFWDEQDNDSG